MVYFATGNLLGITKTSVWQREIHKTFPERNLARHFEAVKVCDRSGKITKQTRSSPFSESEGLLRSGRCADPSRLMNLWITMDNPSWYTPDLRGSSTANLTNGPNVQIQMIQRSCQVHIVNVAYTKDPAAICWDSPSICDDKLSMRTTQASQNHGETWSDLELPVPPAKHTLYMNIYEQISSCKMQADAEGSHGFLEACTNQCRFNRFALHLTSTHCNLPGQRRKCKNVKHSRSLLIVCWLWVRQSPKWWVPCATPCFGPLAFRSLRQARSQWCCDFRWTAPSKLEQTFGGRQPFPPPTPQNLHMWAPYIHIICLLNRKNGCVKHLFGLAKFFGCMFAVHAMRKRAFRWM